MNKNDLIRIRHMPQSAKDAIFFVGTKSRRDLVHDRMLVLSIIKSVEIIGEAATKITKETKNKYPDLPWSDIIARRNRLIHVYYDIDLDRVWDTIIDDLPLLILALEAIVQREESGS